jgi:hypothetical protein
MHIRERKRRSRCACRDREEEHKSQEDASRKTLLQEEQRNDETGKPLTNTVSL